MSLLEALEVGDTERWDSTRLRGGVTGEGVGRGETERSRGKGADTERGARLGCLGDREDFRRGAETTRLEGEEGAETVLGAG